MTHTSNAQREPRPEEVLMQHVLGAVVGRALTLAAKLGVADLLKDGPKTAAEIARRLDANEDAVYRVLRGLTVPGVFRETERRTFALTRLSEPLVSDAPGSMRALVAHMSAPFWHAFAEMEHSMVTGKPSFEKVHGMGVFEYFEKHPAEAKIFDEAMTAFTTMSAEPVARAYDFSGIRTLVDVGGGQGGLLATILKRHPSIHGTLFELQGVAARAQAFVEKEQLKNRMTIETGSFFERVPAGRDAYIMKAIIHDWDDERARKILENTRKAMAPGGRVLVVEQVLTDRPESAFAKLSDLIMLTIPGGKERTAEELEALFKAAGLVLTRIVPTESMVSVIEGKAA